MGIWGFEMPSDAWGVALAFGASLPPTMVALAGLFKAMQIGGKSEEYHEDALGKLNNSLDRVRLIQDEMTENRKHMIENAAQVTHQLEELKHLVETVRIISDISRQIERLMEKNR